MKMVDLGLQLEAMGGVDCVLSNLRDVIRSEQFINGTPVRELELELAKFAGRKYAVACASGTDALLLAMLALDLQGKTVVLPAFGFPSALEVAAIIGAHVVLVDVDERGMMDPSRLSNLLGGAPVRPGAVVVMDLFGTPAQYDKLVPICRDFNVPLLVDAAQSLGAKFVHVESSRFGVMTTTSFFPAKPLGCYGDGGMVFTDDPCLERRLRLSRNHGMGAVKYQHEIIGTNSRLDTLQAAVLLQKLEIFPQELETRRITADLLLTLLAEERLELEPLVPPGNVSSTWACFSVRAATTDARNAYIAALDRHEIAYALHYPRAFVDQPAFQSTILYNDGCCASARALAATIFQLPFHPYLTARDLEAIVQALKKA